MKTDPKIPLDELRRRYDELLPIRELDGSRSFIGRCQTWEMFLENGPRIIMDMNNSFTGRLPEESHRPDLAALIREAWGDDDQ